MDVFHHGTRENPLDDLSLIIPGDDQFIHSLTKRLFLFNLKHTVQCLKCRLITTSYSESRNHFIYPSNNKSVSHLLLESFNSSFEKICTCCDYNFKHEEVLHFEQPPEILILVLSRFDNHVPDIKNRDCIEVDRELTVSSVNYGLIGSIHHHGSSIASGHYTCNIFYPDLAFLCNDNQILPLNASQLSDSVYMFFYARNVLSTS